MNRLILSLTLLSVVIFSEAQNVGIGTSSPATKLHIDAGVLGIGRQDAQDQTPYLQLGLNDDYYQYLTNNAQYNSSTDVWNYVTTFGYGGLASKIEQYSGYIKFSTANGGVNPINWNDRLYIGNDGNVGIGTNSPSYRLDVDASLRISFNNATGGGLFLADDGSMVDLNDGFASMRFSNGVAITNGNNLNTHRIRLNSDGNIQLINGAPTLNFNDSDEPDYYFHINSDRLYILHGDGYNNWNTNRPLTVFQGNKVGINEISPTWRLQTNGAELPSFLAQQNGNHSFGIVGGFETFNNGSGTQDGPRIGFHKHGAKVWAAGIQPGGSNGFSIYEDGYNWGWGTERLTINPGGSVTIHNVLNSKINVRGNWGGWNWWTGCNQHDYWMIPVSEGNCFLTGMLGAMEGGGEGGWIREESGWYVLRLQTCRGNSSMYVTATCIGR